MKLRIQIKIHYYSNCKLNLSLAWGHIYSVFYALLWYYRIQKFQWQLDSLPLWLEWELSIALNVCTQGCNLHAGCSLLLLREEIQGFCETL